MAILGDWAFASQVEDGKTFADDSIRNRQLSFREDHYFHIKPDDGTTFGTYVLDPTTQPKRISFYTDKYKKDEDPEREYHQGIYKFDGDRLLIAYRKDGPVPDDFESTAGSGVTRLVLERTKPR